MTHLHAVDNNAAPLVVVIGDSVLDRTWQGSAQRLCPDSVGPVVDLDEENASPGAAALTALAVASFGCQTVLVTALGVDAAGRAIRDDMHHAGVQVVDLGLDGPTPEKTRVRVDGLTVTRLDRGCTAIAPIRRGGNDASNWIASADAIVLSDYGRGVVPHLWSGRAVRADVPVIWDPHPRSTRPRGRLTLATPNRSEAMSMAVSEPPQELGALAKGLAHQWSCTIALTDGRDGVVLSTTETTTRVPTEPVIGDSCGAGDWFAAGVASALANGDPMRAAIGHGCRAAAEWIRRPLRTSIPREETVVATSGCFDVLHVGHLAMLEHARHLGDRLVVLVNSDDSVRRLKGHGRPVNAIDDRVALLEGLSCVDEVRVFDESTPCEALERLQPAVFVKGADYADAHLEERSVMARWGGRIEFAPLVSGRSTTRVLRLARTIAE